MRTEDISVARNTIDPLSEARANLRPPLKDPVLDEAARALAKSQIDTAEVLIGKFLRKRPHHPDALNLMAEIALRAKRFHDAEALLARCVEKSPHNTGFGFKYAVVLRHLHKHDQALVQVEKLLHMDPGNPLFREQKATILSCSGRFSEALICRRELVDQFPLWPIGWLLYADALRDAGEQTDCVAACHTALGLDPTLTGGYARLASLKVYRFTEKEIAEMEEQLGNAGLTADARAEIHHALGKAYNDSKEYTRSFENYAKGNALRRIEVNFDSGRLTTHRRAYENSFSRTFFCQRVGWGCLARDPIFIVGLPRSGSTLVEQILSSHSLIEGLGELADLDTSLAEHLRPFRDELRLQEFANGSAVDKSSLVTAYIRILDRLSGEDFRAIGEHYLKLTTVRRTGCRPFFTDKTLRNFLYVGLIHLMLPNAKIIDARRHPLDCGWSCFKSQFHGSHFTLNLGDIGRDYVNYVRLMDHFDKVLPGKIYRVIHEKLVDDPESELRCLFDYLGIPFEEQCIRFYENRRPVFTQSSEQVRQPLNRSGMNQWLPYEPWLGPLKEALGPVLDAYPEVPQ